MKTRKALAAVGTLLPWRLHCRLPPGCVLPSYTRGQPEGWAIASGGALGGDTGGEPRGGAGPGPAGEPTRKGRGRRPESARPPGASAGSPRKRASRSAEPSGSGAGSPAGAESAADSLGVWVRGGRGERCGEKRAPTPATQPSARRPAAAACWPGRGLAPRPSDWAKAEKQRCGNPARWGLPGWGRRGPGAWRPRPHHAVPEARSTPGRSFLCPGLSGPPLSLPLLCLVPGSPGGGARGAAGGAAGGSGAALAHAPGPGAVQLPRPQLALLRARPCTSLLNWVEVRPAGAGGPAPFRPRPPQAPPFRATFGFFFRGGAALALHGLDVLHTLGDPFRGPLPPLIQPHSRPRTLSFKGSGPAPGPALSLRCPRRTWSLPPVPRLRSWVGDFCSQADTPSPPPSRCLSTRLPVAPLASVLLESGPSPPDSGVLPAGPASGGTPRGCSHSRLRRTPAALNAQAAAPAPLLACRSLSLVLAWASQEAVA